MKRGRPPTGLTGRRLKRLLHQLCEHAQNDVRRISQHEETATHQLRVRMKKVLALLRLAREQVAPRTMQAMRQHIRAVKHACAQNRDRVVRDRLIDKLARRFHLPPGHRPSPPPGGCERPQADELHHQLHALDLLIRSTRIERLSEVEILQQHACCHRKGRRLLRLACESSDSGNLHRWRHRVKDLYFQSLALPHLRGAARRARRARRLGSLLGRDQDLASLLREPAFAVRRGPWRQIIGEHRERLRQRYLALGHKLYAAHVRRHA